MPRHTDGIADYIGTDQVIRIHREGIDKYSLNGFIVGISAKLLLLQEIDGSTLHMNGYSALRLSDIQWYKLDDSFIGRAMRLLERRPTIPKNVDLASWPALLRSIQFRYPLLMLETEKKRPGAGFIGRIANMTAHEVELIEVNTAGYWAETETFALKDITRVQLDNGYVEALARLVEHEDAIAQKVNR